MALHDSLRELVAARGAAVVDDATELRGALDDFLAEDEATIGELNLLVDAVRLGGLDRMLTMLDNGAAPAAAVAEAGAALARDRGSDDSRRASWAVAALGFALGRVDAPLVERSLPTAAPVDPKPATPPPPPPPPPTPPPLTPQPRPEPDAGPGTVGSPEAVPTAFDRERSIPMSPPPAAPVAPRRKRRSVVLLVVSFAVVLGLVGGIGLALWMERDTSTSAKDPEDDPTADATDDERKGALPRSWIVVSYKDGSESERLWAVDARTGEWALLKEGTDDVLPAISRDRTQLTYLELESEGISVLKVLDLPEVLDLPDLSEPADSDAGEPVFSDSGDCAHARRPGWSPDGSQLAVVCTGETGEESVGLFVAGRGGVDADLVLEGVGYEGSPTWIDDTRFIYNITSDDEPTSFGLFDTTAGDQGAIEVEGTAGISVSHQDWSEEAGKVLFLVHRDGDPQFGELWIANSDFSDPQNLGGRYAHPVWSPDGKAIAFTVEDGGEKLAVADFNGRTLSEYRLFEEVPFGDVGIPVWGSR